MKNLWHFTRESNEPGNSEPLPSYICLAFTNPEMTRRIHGESGLAIFVIGRCVGALVVNKLVAGINARDIPVSNLELACLSAILGTKSDTVLLLLRHRGAIELTNLAFLAWANIDSSGSASVPPDVLHVVHQTFAILSKALPAELNTTMKLDQTDALISVPEGQCELIFRSPGNRLKGAHQGLHLSRLKHIGLFYACGRRTSGFSQEGTTNAEAQRLCHPTSTLLSPIQRCLIGYASNATLPSM